MRTASVSTGLPFAVVLLIGVYALYVGFFQELYVENAVQRAILSAKEKHQLHASVTSVVENGGQRTAAPVLAE